MLNHRQIKGNLRKLLKIQLFRTKEEQRKKKSPDRKRYLPFIAESNSLAIFKDTTLYSVGTGTELFYNVGKMARNDTVVDLCPF